MRDNEQSEFCDMLTLVLETYGRATTSGAMMVWWQALRDRDLADVRSAFDAHVRDPERGRFAPLPADIIAKIPTGHPTPEEAWAMLHHALGDEGATVVLTWPMRTAFYVADPLAGDKIAARMAFLEVYRRELSTATAPRWGVIAGWDLQRRQDALDSAVAAGRLLPSVARQFLPSPATDASTVERIMGSKPRIAA